MNRRGTVLCVSCEFQRGNRVFDPQVWASVNPAWYVPTQPQHLYREMLALPVGLSWYITSSSPRYQWTIEKYEEFLHYWALNSDNNSCFCIPVYTNWLGNLGRYKPGYNLIVAWNVVYRIPSIVYHLVVSGYSVVAIMKVVLRSERRTELSLISLIYIPTGPECSTGCKF